MILLGWIELSDIESLNRNVMGDKMKEDWFHNFNTSKPCMTRRMIYKNVPKDTSVYVDIRYPHKQ